MDSHSSNPGEHPAQLPDPNGPPVPVNAADDPAFRAFVENVQNISHPAPDVHQPYLQPSGGSSLLSELTTMTAIAGGIFGAVFVIGSVTQPTMGATVSAKLQWQERQRQIEIAHQSESQSAPNDNPAHE